MASSQEMMRRAREAKRVKHNPQPTIRNVLLIGETDFTVINWSPELRKKVQAMDNLKLSKNELVGHLGYLLDEDRFEKLDLADRNAALFLVGQYLDQCETPNTYNDLNRNHNYTAVFIGRTQGGYSARWLGSFTSTDDQTAYAMAANSLIKVIRRTFDTDKVYLGHSPAYDLMKKMLG